MKAGWEVKPLGEVCDVLDRLRKPITKKDRTRGPYPYYGATGVLDHVDNFLFDEQLVLIGEDGAKWDAGDNSAFAVNGKIWVNNHAHVIRPDRSVLSDDWLIYFLNFSDLSEFITGMTVPKLNQARMREIPIPIPPLEEQKRIVAVLDTAFEGLTRAKENAEANLQNARELFEEAKDKLLTDADDTWLRGKLEVLVGPVATGPFGSLLHKSDYVIGQTPIVNPAHIIDGKIIPDLAKTIGSATMARLTSYVMKKGDIVIGRRGDMGRCATVGELEGGWLCGTGSFFIRPSRNVEPELVSHVLRSRSYVAKLESLSTGATMLNISNKTLASLELVLPPIEKQSGILVEIDSLAEKTTCAEASYRIKLTDIEDLRQSLLQKAFAGELT